MSLGRTNTDSSDSQEITDFFLSPPGVCPTCDTCPTCGSKHNTRYLPYNPYPYPNTHKLVGYSETDQVICQ